jgi:F-type H+-transporting ATPase subunit gamma
MPSLKSIRKRIGSVKSTQKITRAMKMVAGARLARAQQRIVALRPYAVKTQEVLASVLAAQAAAEEDDAAGGKAPHPLLVRRPERRVLYLVLTSDRGLCGSFNTNLNKGAERQWREDVAAGREPTFYVVGRKGNDFLRRRNAPVGHTFRGVWESTDLAQARLIASTVLAPFRAGEVDSIKLVYNQFRSAMSQTLVVDQLLPVVARPAGDDEGGARRDAVAPAEYLYEPDPDALLDRLVPMYLEITLLRALYESQASEFGARMTAMDSATKNAKEMISSLTLQYNRARQAAITKELMEIIGGAEALKE